MGSARATRPLSIAVNLLWLVPGVVGGSETYAVGLLDAWAGDPPPGIDLTLFVNGRFTSAHPGIAAALPTVVAPISGTSKARRVVAETTWLGLRTRGRYDLVHHLGGITPLWRPVPTVVTIHDLQPLAMPEHFHPVKRGFIATVVPPSARSARRIVTLSDHVRRDIEARLHVPLDRIDVVSPGLDRHLIDDVGDLTDLDEVRRRYDLGARPYFVYPAITYPHKNHRVLVEAFAELVRGHETGTEPLLVLTGGAGSAEGALRALLDQLGIGRLVRRTGWVPYGDLDALVRGATALVYPSRYEGFGLPPLEAMARGCPVIAAAATTLPDVVGDGGWLVDPGRPDEWCKAMRRVLDDPAARADLVVAGEARAAAFDWGRSVRALADVYRRAATP